MAKTKQPNIENEVSEFVAPFPVRDLTVLPDLEREIKWFKEDLEEYEDFTDKLSNLQGALSSLALLVGTLTNDYVEMQEDLWKKYNALKEHVDALNGKTKEE